MDVVINYKNWVNLNLVLRAFPVSLGAMSPHPPLEGKSPGNEAGLACGCGLCVNKMADAKLEIKNPIETAVSRGASLVELEKVSIPESRFSLLADPDCESVIIYIVNCYRTKTTVSQICKRDCYTYCLTYSN